MFKKTIKFVILFVTIYNKILCPYRSGQVYDIYYSPSKNFYIKRMCVCSDGCLSKCGKNKNKLNCDGHHAIIVSLNDSLDIDVDNDYVIDFTYKQMVYSAAKTNMEIMKKLPDYFVYSLLRICKLF